MFALVYNDQKNIKLYEEQFGASNIQVLAWPEADLANLPSEVLTEEKVILVDGNSFFDLEIELFLSQIQDNYPVFLSLRYEQDKVKFPPIVRNSEKQIIWQKEEAIDCYCQAGISMVQPKLVQPYSKASWAKLSWPELLPQLVEAGLVYADLFGGFFLENSSPNFAKQVQAKLKEVRVPALFLDRDNLLIYDEGYTVGTDVQALSLADDYIAKANAEKNPVLVVSNQSGVARGFFALSDVVNTNLAVKRIFAKKGLQIDDFFICPYHTQGKDPKYLHLSKLRKPEAAMLMQAAYKYRIDFQKSLMLGDNPDTDIINLSYLECKILG